MMNNKTFFLVAMMCFAPLVHAQKTDKHLKVHLDFEFVENSSIRDVTGNKHDGILMNDAVVKSLGKYKVLDLGGDNGYLDFGKDFGTLVTSLEDFTIATCLYIGSQTDLTKHGNFVWAFSTHEFCNATMGEYVAYKVNFQRYEQSTGGWEHEVVGMETGKPAANGKWQHIAYVQSNGIGTVYVDGQVLVTGKAPIQPKDITTPTVYNWLGKAPFRSDVYLRNAMYSDFRIYDKPLMVKEIKKLAERSKELNAITQ